MALSAVSMYAIINKSINVRIDKLQIEDNCRYVEQLDSTGRVSWVAIGNKTPIEARMLAKVWLEEEPLLEKVHGYALIELYGTDSELIGKGKFIKNSECWVSCDTFYVGVEKEWELIDMDNAQTLNLLKKAESALQSLQTTSANRDRAVTLTHLQTAILWLEKETKQP